MFPNDRFSKTVGDTKLILQLKYKCGRRAENQYLNPTRKCPLGPGIWNSDREIFWQTVLFLVILEQQIWILDEFGHPSPRDILEIPGVSHSSTNEHKIIIFVLIFQVSALG